MVELTSQRLPEFAGFAPDPFEQFGRWFADAKSAGIELYDAMALATASRNGRPSVRMVMLRGFDRRGFVFFTNYESPKARDLAENPYAALLFHWARLGRQVRISGRVTRTSREESEAYFRSRPFESQVAALVSPQSQVIPSWEALESAFQAKLAEFAGREVPLPPFWGGFRVEPDWFEFWKAGPYRLHNRVRYTREGENWRIELLAP
jgi:pyridoxamine 5'-phosphate oxidase